jgi:hypothetical protein
MTSYKTLVFGTIAFVCAASPAFADSGSALPGPQQMDSGSALPKYLVISGVAGLPPLAIDISWFNRFIDR